MDTPTTLLMTHILRCLPTAQYHSLVCCAGSQGYHSLKEMLQSGAPGNTLLIESGDLREVGVVGATAPHTYDVDMVVSDIPCHSCATAPDASSSLGRCLVADDSDTGFADETLLTISPGISPSSSSSCCCFVYCYSNNLDTRAQGGSRGHMWCGEHIPETVSYVTILSNMGMLPPSMLALCKTITTVDMSLLFPHPQTIYSNFMSGCVGLTALDLNPLSNVTDLQINFLKDCSSLQTLDLGGEGGAFSKLTTIRGGFLSGCSSLQSLDLSPLGNVTVIGINFLMGCRRLKTLDLSPLRSVYKVSHGFLDMCHFRVLDTSTLRKQLRRVPPNFPDSVDMAMLKQATKDVRKAKLDARAERKSARTKT